MSQVPHQAGAYPGFCGIKPLGVFLLPAGWDTNPLHGYPRTHSYTWSERGTVNLNTTQCHQPRIEPAKLNPEMSALIMRPVHLPG